MSTWEKFADAKGHIHGKVIAVLVTIALVFSFTNIYVWDEAFGTDDEAATQEVAADETGAQDGIVEPDAESGSDGAIVPADKPAADEPATGGEPADGDSSEGAAAADDKSDADAANEADKPAADEPDATDEVVMPKVTLTAVAEDGATVKVNAPQGALPEGTTISVTKVSSKKIEKAAEAALPEDQVLESYAAYDVKLFDASGNEIEPEKNVTITITGTGISKSDSTIMHMNQAGTAVVDSSEGNSMSTASFSIYIVAEGGVQDEEGEAVYFTTYKFENEDGSEAAPTQKVTNGDKLAEPSVTAPAGKYFVGWFNGETEFTGFGTVSGVDANSTVTLTAKFADAKYVFFYNADGTQIMHTEVVTDSAAHDFSSVTYDIDSTHSVSGWAATKGGSENIASAISVPADKTSVNVYAIVTSGHWISFDSDGGSIVNSVFVPDDQTVTLPSDPIKVGYKFQGWFNGDTQIKTGDTLSDSITVVARWTPATVNYTVNYWKQKVTDNVNAADADKTYDFEASVTKQAEAGTKVSAVNDRSFAHFVYNSNNSSKDVAIAGDGTTVINVYYDRIKVTVQFYVYQKGTWFEPGGYKLDRSYTGLYEQPLPDGAWQTDTYGWNRNDGNGAILLTSFDPWTAGYTDNTTTDATGNATTKFYSTNKSKFSVTYYNEKYDGTFEKKDTIYTTNNVSFYEKYVGYELYKQASGSSSGDPTQAGFWTGKTNLSEGDGVGKDRWGDKWSSVLVASKLKTYDLSYYNYNGVSKSVEDIKYTTPLTAYSSYVPPRPEGLTSDYRFKGWYADKACTVPFAFDKETMPNANLQVYAKWAQEPVGIKYSYYLGHDNSTEASAEALAGTLISTVLPSVSDDGDWKFVGWVDANGNPIDLATYKVTSSVQLKGKWVYTKELSVQYKNGVSVIDGADTNKYYDGAMAKAVEGLSEDGKYFLGWETEAGVFVMPGQNFTVSAEDAGNDNVLTLTAVWGDKETVTTITYDKGNGNGENSTSSYLANNETVTVATPESLNFTAPNDDYYFAGWSTTATGDAAIASGSEIVVNAQLEEGKSNVLYAVWKKKAEVTVTAKSDEVVYNGSEQSVTGFVGEDSNGIPVSVNGQQCYVTGLTASASGIDAGGYDTTVEGDAKVYDADGNEITNKVKVSVVAGTLTIDPKPVTLSTETESWEYDGAEHSATAVSGTEGFYDRDRISATASETVKNAGDSKTNAIAVTGADAKPGLQNYVITKDEGTISVYAKSGVVVTIAEESGTVTYNGAEQKVSGYTVKSIKVGSEATGLYTASDFRFTGTEDDQTAKGTDAGTYDMGLTPAMFENTNSNFESVTFVIEDGTLTIDPKPVTLSTETESWEYDGAEHSATAVSGTEGFYDRDRISATASETVKNAGDSKTNAIAVTGADAKPGLQNYVITKDEGTISVYAKSGVVVTIAEESGTVTYNGAEQKVSGYTVKSIKVGSEATGLYTASDFRFTGTEDDQTAKGTDAGTYDMGLTPAMFENTNSNFESVTFVIEDGTLTIDPKPVTLSTETESWEYDGAEHSATAVSGTEGFYDRDRISATASETVKNAGDSKTNAIAVTGADAKPGLQNYVITKDEGTISVYAKSGVVVTIAEESGTVTYNGAEQKVSGYTVKSIKVGSEATGLYTASDFRFTGTEDDQTAKGTDAGTYDMGLTPAMFENTNSNFESVTFVIEDGTLTIDPKPVTLSTETESWEYDGAEHSATAVSGTEGFYDRDRISATASETVKNAGDSKTNAIAVTGADAKPGLQNYVITKDEGTISVYAKSGVVVTIAEESGTVTYNGAEQKVSGYTVKSIKVGSEATGLYTASDFRFTGTEDDQTAKGTDAGTYDMGLTPAMFENTNSNFESVTFVIEDGTLTIDPKPVTLSTETESWEYDGAEHSATAVSGTEGFYDRDRISATASETVKNAGDSKTNAIAVTGADAKPGLQNYVITKDEGTISVYAKSGVVVTIAEESGTVTYNGAEQKVSGYTVKSIKVGSEATGLYTASDFRFTGTEDDQTAKGTDAGTYDMGLTPAMFENTNSNFESVTFVIEDGTLTIDPKPVTLSTETESWEYDGAEHSATAVSGTEGFYDRDRISATASETVKNAGDSKTNAIAVTGADAKPGLQNYVITKDEGTISVYAKSGVVVTIAEESGTVTYNGAEQKVSGYTVKSIKVGSEATGLYTASDFRFTGTEDDQTAKGTDAGTYDMGLTPAMFENTNSNFESVTFVIEDGTLTIDPKPVTLSTETESWEYDGAEHSATAVSGTEGFYDRDRISATASETVKNAGDSKTNAIAVTGADAKPGLQNYVITKDEGTISVYAKSGVVVTIAEESGTVTYNGAEQKVSGYTVKSIKVGSEATGLYTASDFRFTGTEDDQTAKGTDAGTYDMGLTPAMFENTNSNFESVTFVIEDGTLTIDPKPVELTSATLEKKYDTFELTNANAKDSGVTGGESVNGNGLSVENGWVDGEGATYTFTGSQTLVGDTLNAFSYTLKPNTKADNYTITKSEGKLIVTAGTDADPVKPELVVTKTHENKTYGLGDTITFIVKVTNIYDEAKDITLTEIAGFYFTDATGDDKQTLTLQGVAAGATEEVEVTHVVTEADILNGGEKHELMNTVTAELEGKSYTADDVATLDEPNAHMTVTKETTSTPANGETYALGETITYKVTVENDGNLTLTNVAVIDDLTDEDWTIASLAPGAKEEFTTSYVVTEADILAGKVVNEATATGNGPDGHDPGEESGSSTDETDDPNGHITVVKETTSTPENEKTYALGETITYEVTVTNDGNLTLTDVVVTDDLTGGKWTIESFAPGDSKTYTTSHKVTEADILKGSVLNVATATGKSPDPDKPEPGVEPGEKEDPTDPKDNTLGVEKHLFSINDVEYTDSVPPALKLGDKVVYAITVTNLGNVTISDIVVEDALTGNIDENLLIVGELKPGESKVVYSDEYVVTEDDILNNEVENVATATGTDPEGEKPEGTGDTDNATEQKDPSIHVAKSVLTVNGDEFKGGDLKLGDEVVYKLIVTNNGNVTISGIQVTDELTGNDGNDAFTVDELKPGEAVEFTTKPYVVTEADILAGVVKNLATATGTDPKGEEPEVTPGIDEKPTDDPKGMVSISKKATSTPDNGRFYVEGERISYEITATNTGNLTATDVVVTDKLTGDEWTIASLAPGASKSFKTSYTVTAADVRSGEVVNVATGTGTTVDPDNPPKVTPGETTVPTGVDPVPPVTPRPDGPLGPVIDVLSGPFTDPEPADNSTQIGDDETPQAGFDHVDCWVHYYIILGLIITAIYGVAVVVRRSNNSRRLQKLDDEALGKTDEAQAASTETVKEA